jgi:hypothetical protein
MSVVFSLEFKHFVAHMQFEFSTDNPPCKDISSKLKIIRCSRNRGAGAKAPAPRINICQQDKYFPSQLSLNFRCNIRLNTTFFDILRTETKRKNRITIRYLTTISVFYFDALIGDHGFDSHALPPLHVSEYFMMCHNPLEIAGFFIERPVFVRKPLGLN